MGAVVAHRTAWATALADGVMWLGTTSRGLGLLLLVAIAALALTRAYRAGVAAVVAMIVGTGCALLLKAAFERPRPPMALVTAHDSAFPSAQAAQTAALGVAVVVAAAWPSAVVRRWVAGALAALVLLVGACMVYLGAHWPTDILAGWLLGGVIGLVTGRLCRAPSQRSQPQRLA